MPSEDGKRKTRAGALHTRASESTIRCGRKYIQDGGAVTDRDSIYYFASELHKKSGGGESEGGGVAAVAAAAAEGGGGGRRRRRSRKFFALEEGGTVSERNYCRNPAISIQNVIFAFLRHSQDVAILL